MILKAYAKLNLTLDVTGKRADGYHTLSSVMQEISLCDDVAVEVAKSKTGNIVEIASDDKTLPHDEKNTCYKAAQEFTTFFKTDNIHIKIGLKKRIPVAAGFGGGSTDAAAVLKALNKLLSINAPTELLEKLAVRVGADVPFFIRGGLQLAEGIGDKLTPLKFRTKPYFIVAKPIGGAFSGKIYNDFDSMVKTGRIRASDAKFTTKQFLSAMEQNEDPFLHIGNMLTPVTTAKCPDVSRLLSRFEAFGIRAAMTGSGSAVFAPFHAYSAAVDALAQVRENEEFIAICIAN